MWPFEMISATRRLIKISGVSPIKILASLVNCSTGLTTFVNMSEPFSFEGVLSNHNIPWSTNPS